MPFYVTLTTVGGTWRSGDPGGAGKKRTHPNHMQSHIIYVPSSKVRFYRIKSELCGKELIQAISAFLRCEDREWEFVSPDITILL